MEVLVFQQLIKAVEPLQSHEMPISLSFCTFSIIPDANCCQLQHYLLSLCCQTGFLCPSGMAAVVQGSLLCRGCEQAGGAALAVPLSLSRWDALLCAQEGLAWAVLRQSLTWQSAPEFCGAQDTLQVCVQSGPCSSSVSALYQGPWEHHSWHSTPLPVGSHVSSSNQLPCTGGG